MANIATMPRLRHEKVALEVRAWRGRFGMSQVEMADLLGIAQNGISRRLAGLTPFTLNELDTLAQHWGLRMAVLLGEEPPSPDELAVAALRLPQLDSNQQPAGYTASPWYERVAA